MAIFSLLYFTKLKGAGDLHVARLALRRAGAFARSPRKQPDLKTATEQLCPDLEIRGVRILTRNNISGRFGVSLPKVHVLKWDTPC